MSHVAAFRTYTWDADVATLAARFFAACPEGGRHVVLADESRGRLPIEGYEVVPYSQAGFAQLGLVNEPAENALWFNVDYSLYALRLALPGFDHYLVSESDVAVNLPLGPLLAAAPAFDFLGHQTQEVAPDWHFRPTVAQAFPKAWRTMLFFNLATGPALDVLLAARLRHAAAFKAGQLRAWPFCEGFVPSVLKEAGLRLEEASRFADTTHLNFRPRVEISDPLASRPGALVHSVLGRGVFMKAVAKEALVPGDWLDPDSVLGRTLRRYPLAGYATELLQAFERQGDYERLQLFLAVLEREGLAPAKTHDLARNKPALTSSTCQWSRAPGPQCDARGAVTFSLAEDFGFHTDEEMQPWWMVDLGGEAVIDEIRITNRAALGERFVTFIAETSLTGATWTMRHAKLTPEAVSSDPDQPYKIVFPEPLVARYVRLKLLGWGILHLRRVQVLGRELPPRPDYS
jgi:hypothetical protein